MTSKKTDIKEEAVELIGSNEDDVTTSRLTLANLEIKLKELECRQEECRLNRLEKNSNRRPTLYRWLVTIIITSYTLFFLAISIDLFLFPLWGIESSENRLFEIALLGGIPTLLITVAMKAIFSTAPKKETESQIKLSDVIPINAIKDASSEAIH